MKNLLLIIFLLGVIYQAESQTKKPATTPSELLEKSDNQYTAGWILLGSGTAFLITSWAITPSYDYYEGSSGRTVDAILGWTGTLSLIASVPVFLSAGQNARLAARLSLQNQTLHQPIPLPGQPRNFPSISLKIPL